MNRSEGKVPFSWENKPGICKATGGQVVVFEEDYSVQKLPPPPCRTESAKISMHEIEIPLPPCVFQPPFRTSSNKTDDDPFLAAYKECTKISKKGNKLGKKGFFIFSCKRSCSIRNDNIVRVSQLPLEKDID